LASILDWRVERKDKKFSFHNENNIIHPENIFMNSGEVIQINGIELQITNFFNDVKMSDPYNAPERLKKKINKYDNSDAWAVGILTYFLLTGEYPNKQRLKSKQ
jgi:serine/threonine protein kinase